MKIITAIVNYYVVVFLVRPGPLGSLVRNPAELGSVGEFTEIEG